MASSARVAASLDGTSGGGNGGGKEPDPKKRRLLNAGGPVEDDETARQKMRDAGVYERGVASAPGEHVGFDPDNVRDVKSSRAHGNNDVTPMTYFADIEGDLPMMRWLYVNGADTRGEQLTSWFPLYRAARCGHLDICEWLFQHGAAGDIKRRARSGLTPLSITFHRSDMRDLSRWLILRGALCKEDGAGDLDVDLVKEDLNQFDLSDEERPELLNWAREHHQCRASFGVFLMGTLSIPEYSAAKLRNELLARIRSEQVVDRLLRDFPQDEYHLLWDGLFAHRVCSLAAFCGKSGILELIGDFVGIMRGHEARIVRQLTELLPGVIAELDEEQAAYIPSDDSDDSE